MAKKSFTSRSLGTAARTSNTIQGFSVGYFRFMQAVAPLAGPFALPIVAGSEAGVQGIRFVQHKTGVAKYGTLGGAKVPRPKLPRNAIKIIRTAGVKAVGRQVARAIR